MLDADNVPLIDPATLFDTPHYREHGAIFGPITAISLRTAASGRFAKSRPAMNGNLRAARSSSNKRRCWEAMNLAMHYNEHSDFYYAHIYGDKDTFHLAFRRVGKSYAMPAHRPANGPRHDLPVRLSGPPHFPASLYGQVALRRGRQVHTGLPPRGRLPRRAGGAAAAAQRLRKARRGPMESRALDGPPERPPHPARVGPAPINAVYTWVNGSDRRTAMSGHRMRRCARRGGQRGGPLEEQRRAALQPPLTGNVRPVDTGGPHRHQRAGTAWLDLGNPRVRLVTHAEIFRWPEDLPTFNSVAIETHLHRIPGLAERFVYFNDDTFLGAACGPEDFFTADGRLCVRFRHEALPCNEGPAEVSAADRGAANANGLLAFEFGPGRYHYPIHQARPLTRTLFEDAHRRRRR